VSVRDLYNNLKAEIALKGATLKVATEGEIIDLAGFNGALICVASGTITDGTGYEFELKEGNNADLSDAAAVADEDILGSEPTFAADDDDTVKQFGYIGNKRYIRLDLKTVSGSPSTGGVFLGLVVKGYPRHAPVS
jgi:hypothetical protein